MSCLHLVSDRVCRFGPVAMLAVALLAAPRVEAVEWAASGAASTPAGQDADDRAQIAMERSAAQARFVERERECEKRFMVTSCMDEAKAERRRTIDRLRQRQLVVDEARRQQRVEKRKAELAEKAAEDARRDAARALHPAASAPPPQRGLGLPFESPRKPTEAASPAVRPKEPMHRAASAPRPRPQESPADRKRREDASRAAFEARKAEAEAHRQQVLERTARRTAQKPPARPLPPAPAQTASAAASPH